MNIVATSKFRPAAPVPALLSALALCLGLVLAPASAPAHPHAFVECTLDFVFDEAGLAGIRHTWFLDEMLSMNIMQTVGVNGFDGLSADERESIAANGFANLANFGYFTDLRVDHGRKTDLSAQDFSVRLDGAKLVYRFFIPCRVPADGPHKVKAAVYDSSFYTYVDYCVEGRQAPDPTDDPLFGDASAPARPEDFERFSRHVDMGDGEARAGLEGPAALFKASTALETAPEMTYFHGQIVPDAFVLSFGAP